MAEPEANKPCSWQLCARSSQQNQVSAARHVYKTRPASADVSVNTYSPLQEDSASERESNQRPRQRGIYSRKRYEPETATAMSQQSEVNRGGETAKRFEIVLEIRRQYHRFNTMGTQLTVRLNPPSSPDIGPIDHFLASVNDLFEHALRSAGDGHIVGIAIHNETNQNDTPIGISFRRRDQLSVEAI